MMKRWCKVDFLFFNLWGSAHELWVKQVAYYLNQNFSCGNNANIIVVPFEEVIKELLTKIDHKYRWILLKRYMLRIADKISQEYWYLAVVKWDSLWQVSSQTLKNMFVIDKACQTLVLRPLITYNKQEIVDLSMKIWTYNFAVNMPEYCGVISDRPSTWAKLEDIENEELKISDEILSNAYNNKKVEKVENLVHDMEIWEIQLAYLPWENEVIVDIREKAQISKNPLKYENTEIIEIPFFDINNRFKDLEQNKVYLFYCDKWVLSNLHWLYLKEKWFNNIKIFRPLEDKNSCKI
jgi:thiamine biosynthesis protein ThiI